LTNIGLFVGLLLHTFRSDDVGFKFWARQHSPSVRAIH
jgi:hypothetical protein